MDCIRPVIEIVTCIGTVIGIISCLWPCYVAHKLLPPSVQEEPTDLTVGMESMFEKAWSLIGNDEVRIMGIHGKGGVGKTTLLKKINNEFLKSTTHGFDVVILVVVSNTLNIDAIQMEIGKRLGLSSPDRTSIFNTLKKKKFVLLLDDIWERVDLQSIGVPSVENSKSKVIFTTRDEAVYGLMDANSKNFKVECLPWDEAWILFQNKVGNEALNSDPEVPELAKVVAKECGGLPLALITIGRAMSSKKTVHAWAHAITTLRKSASEFPGMVDKVLRLLRLSYDSLHDETIKSCFLYCALFPEDHSIDKSKLVDYWIGEGLIILDESDDIDDARNHGYDVIGILKGACLLETGYNEETQVKMHDTIRDLALWIADEIKKDKMVIARASDHTSERLWFNAERVYYLRDSFEIKLIAPPKSPNIRTLLFEGGVFHINWCIPNNFFELMPFLRVLDLSYSEIKLFPTSITELIELQYLNLSHTDIQVIPEELRKLVKLRYLNLSYMWYLTEIPSGVIGSLLQLRVLNVGYSYTEWDIEEGYNLKYLNDLQIGIHTQQKLNKLLNNQNLLKCVTRLILLSLHRAELTNHYFYNIEQPQHLGSCFQNLTEIRISDCDAFKDLTWAGYVGNLKKLVVTYCDELEEIVKVADDFDFGGSTGGGGDEIAVRMNNVQDVFKSLETLTMGYLPELKSICRNALAFPCLKYIRVSRCPQLKKLPFDSASNINKNLQKITVDGEQEWWSELQWEDRDNIKTKFHYSGRTWKPQEIQD